MKPFIALATIAVLASSATLPAQTDTLSSVSAHLKAVESMKAGFTQTDQKGRTRTGTLTMKRPGRIRFDYGAKSPILLVSDGSGLVFIDYTVKQVQRWPIKNTPLGVLLDPSRDLSRFAKIMPTDDPKLLIVETKDPKHPEYGRLTLAFSKLASAPGGLMLHGWISIDGQNNRTTIKLSGQQFNVAVSDKSFAWKDPRIKGGR